MYLQNLLDLNLQDTNFIYWRLTTGNCLDLYVNF